MKLKADPEKIKAAVENGDPIAYQVPVVDKDASEFFLKVAHDILKNIDKEYLLEFLSYIVRECVFNADKANLKRIHFTYNGLDIKDQAQYEQGMSNFAMEFREKLDEYRELLKKFKYYTKVIYLIKNNILILAVKNNSLPTAEEVDRIQTRINKAKNVKDMAEIYTQVEDSSEGAGLGTMMIVMMLRGMGVSENAFKFSIDEKNKEAVAQVTIPLNTVTQSQEEEISSVIADEVSSIPHFPENISQLQQMLRDEETQFTKVASVIQRDPSLTAELLKIVNSAQYMLPNKMSNITNAVSLIGIKGLKALLYSYGSQKTMRKRYGKKMDELWEHAYLCASYAYNIAVNYNMKSVQDDAYIGGILHDIGKIVLMETHPGLTNKINAFCNDKGIRGNFLENLTVGASHAKIGSLIAKKWNFPETIVSAIEFHHKPLMADDESREIVEVVYLANMLTHIKEERFEFYLAEESVLKKFKLNSENDVYKLYKKLEKKYQQQQSKS